MVISPDEQVAARLLARLTGHDLRDVVPHMIKPVCGTRPLSAVEYIVVHCGGETIGDTPMEQRAYINEAAVYHMRKDWRTPNQKHQAGGPIYGDGLMYHFVVGRDGALYLTRNLSMELWHAHAANAVSLAILLPGDFNQPTTEAQQVMLARLLDQLCGHSPELPARKSDVWGHGELTQFGNSTVCPGGQVVKWLKQYRSGHIPAYADVSLGL